MSSQSPVLSAQINVAFLFLFFNLFCALYHINFDSLVLKISLSAVTLHVQIQQLTVHKLMYEDICPLNKMLIVVQLNYDFKAAIY